MVNADHQTGITWNSINKRFFPRNEPPTNHGTKNLEWHMQSLRQENLTNNTSERAFFMQQQASRGINKDIMSPQAHKGAVNAVK